MIRAERPHPAGGDPRGAVSRGVIGGKLGVMFEITRLLAAAAHGDRQAAADLLPLVYEELRKLAAANGRGANRPHA